VGSYALFDLRAIECRRFNGTVVVGSYAILGLHA
jgi:hypothetical protein